MLKYVLLGSAIMLASPVVAQDRSASPSGAEATGQVPQNDQGNPAERQPAPMTDPAVGTAPNGSETAQSKPAAKPDPTSPEQVTTIVNAEFASYDKDGNGHLDKTEFAAWMDALKAKAADARDKPGNAKWNEAAFVKADRDKSTLLTKAELTRFLVG